MAFPAIIIVPALLQVAHAQLPSHFILPDAAGNVVVNGDYDETNGPDWTVLANGGTTSPFSVEIKSGASLTGDESRRNGVEVTREGYTIRNSGSLDVGNYGVLSAAGNTLIQNNTGGLIQGGYDGIRFGGERLKVESIDLAGPGAEVPGNKVVNDGLIIGSSSGISSYGSGYDMVSTRQKSSPVTDVPIYGAATLTVENHESGVITGNFGPGILAEGGLVVVNDGLILGGADTEKMEAFAKPRYYRNGSGIFARSDANITNHGIITGTNGDGITTYDGLVLENSGAISGLGNQDIRGKRPLIFFGGSGNGISTGNNAVIVNQESGAISGKYCGVTAGSNLELTNYGTISGTNADTGYAGVNASSGTVIRNYGTIEGDQYGIILNNQQTFTLNSELQLSDVEVPPSSTISNSGTISGGRAAIQLGFGDNVVNFDSGSTVLGDIIGGEGNDTLNFLSGSEAPDQQNNIVHGSVFGIETITKSQSGYAFIGGPGESVEVFADKINITGGGLIINGSLASQNEGKTQPIFSS